MPEHKQTITVAGYSATDILALSYGTLEQLSWTIKYAAANFLIGYTPRSWNRYDNEITIEAEEGQMTITSKMVHGEAFDMMGRTKKDVAGFLEAFEDCKTKATTAKIEEWKQKIETLQQDTVKIAEEEIKQTEELDKVMNFSKGGMQITYAIIAVNILIFILMLLDGAGLFEPDGRIHGKWGSNYTALTLSGDGWRLVTNLFIHFGLIHLALNMYALYSVAFYLEPMLGKLRFFIAYISAGVIASLASLWWHTDGVNSAGASGAIFGLYGLLLALLLTKRIPDAVRKGLLPSVLVFVFYNLVYGMKGGIDNAAHIGGLLAGFVIGGLYAIVIKKENNVKKQIWPSFLVAALAFAAGYIYLQNNVAGAAERTVAKAQINSAAFKDGERFNEQLLEFDKLHERAQSAFSDKEQTDEEFKKKLLEVSAPALEQIELILAKTKSYDVSADMHAKADKLLEYAHLRKEEINILIQMIDSADNETMIPRLNAVREKQVIVYDEALKLQ